MKPISKGAEKVGLISIGALETKIPIVLYPLLLSADIALGVYKNYDYPQDLSVEIVNEIKSLLHNETLKSVFFDLRVHNWANTRYARHSRILSRSIQEICSDLEISSSLILSNGGQLIGNAVGVYYEMMEAGEVLRGEGPLDLTKFALEMGADFLIMMKRVQQRIEAKKWLRDKIVSRNLMDAGKEMLSQASSHFVFTEKLKYSSKKKGYIHHLVMPELQTLRSELASTHPGIGFSFLKKTGDWVEKGDDIIEVCLPKGQENPLEEGIIQKAFVISTDPPNYQPLILEKPGLRLFS
jgi:pyrimidine-nucleoside phosphorylase